MAAGLAALTHERLAPERQRLARLDNRVLAHQLRVSAIAAPTGRERRRARWVARRMSGYGYDVRIDDAGNVVAREPDRRTGPALYVIAHLDTVFPAGTDLEFRVRGERIHGPGISDNGRGIAVMLAIAATIRRIERPRVRPLIFVASTGEEGDGNLSGARHLFDTVEAQVGGAVILDGAGDDRVVHEALGARRFRLRYAGPGGHSWSAYGVPNPVHAAGIAAAHLARLALPRDPRTTLTVSRIAGGMSVNSIPRDATLELDLRSTSPAAMRRVEREIAAIAQAAAQEESGRRRPGAAPLAHSVELIGDRPSGCVSADDPLVKLAVESTRVIGREPELCAASTDANVPISRGIPAVAIGGGGRCGDAHTRDEWYENTEGALGIARALTLVCAAADLPGR